MGIIRSDSFDGEILEEMGRRLRALRLQQNLGQADLAVRGRVLLRPSGTEPVVRVMVEGEDRAHVQGLADAIAAVVKATAERAVA